MAAQAEASYNATRNGAIHSEGSCRLFSLDEVLTATNNFDDALVIGNGGFGKVYRGLIKYSGFTKTVALKRLNAESKQGAGEFWTEVKMLSKLRHTHLVSLIGYCDELLEMILVYEYIGGGTLANHLYNPSATGSRKSVSPLTWEQRLTICIGAARGLHYLHAVDVHTPLPSSELPLENETTVGQQIRGDTDHVLDNIGAPHGVRRSQRVTHAPAYLDDFVCNATPSGCPAPISTQSDQTSFGSTSSAKICDFGLSKGTASHSTSHVSTDVKGTFGYLDPEYFLTRRLTTKSDVYAFGVVLLEVLCGRPPVDTRLVEEQIGLVQWAQHCIKKGKLDGVIDPSLFGQIAPSCLKSFVELASTCLHKDRKSRPTMAEVLGSLELALVSQQKGRTEGIIIKAFQIIDQWLRFRKDNGSSRRQSKQGQRTIVASFGSEEGPGIEDFQILGEAKPGHRLLGRGILVRGTSLCLFQWVRHFPDGSRQYIKGATNPEYFVTADDVGKCIAIEYMPMDDRGRKIALRDTLVLTMRMFQSKAFIAVH
ncbi:hypothetical protein RHGRI_019409 [Rhododendron griersonianum]|uniref:Protein kinase domain-containing protein n=1 Tax=Rhododendron griersonianum TaxID=479676 RepID=A0AAV6JFX2_9ERIC|nr:hypothetical protein RHGRI_019409 [Rhododendron griersonianum]